MEPFVVKQYSGDERPIIKGNGFDGLEIGQDREEAERFVAFVNAAVAAERERCAELETALEALVNRCNADFVLAADEAVIAAEAALERLYRARKA